MQPAPRMIPTRKFDVTPKPLKMLLGIALFGAAACLFYVKMCDPRGVLINNLIELGPLGADILWGVLVFASLAMVAFAGLGLARSFGEKVYITLDSHAIVGPRNWNSNRLVRIEYRSIGNLNHSRISNHEFLAIKANDGRKIKVGQTHFRISGEWAEFLQDLQKNLSGIR
jgi:hypothetical protein